MKAHAIGPFRFEILIHETTEGDRSILETFVVDAFYRGQPLNWRPGEIGKDDFPGRPNRQRIQFSGPKQNRDGSRGTDWRPRLWPHLMFRAQQAAAAAEQGKTIADLRDWKLQPFEEPRDLRDLDFEAASEHVTGARRGKH